MSESGGRSACPGLVFSDSRRWCGFFFHYIEKKEG